MNSPSIQLSPEVQKQIISKKNLQRKIRKPIFIVGCCNSGTTILWRALLGHKELDGPKIEGQDIKDLPKCMKHFLGKQTFRMFAHPKFNNAYHLTEENYENKLAEEVISVYAEHCAIGKRFVEKSPANSMRTRFLQSIFPDAYFVIVVRNGFAVSEGIVRKRLFDPERPHMAGLQTTIKEAAEQWLNANRILLQDRPYLERSIIIKYEDLVNKTTEIMHTVLRFCECDLTNIKFPKLENDLNKKQIGSLTLEEKNNIRTIAGDMLNYFDY